MKSLDSPEFPESREALEESVRAAGAAFLRFDRLAVDRIAARLGRAPSSDTAQGDVGAGVARAFCAFLSGAPAPDGLETLASRATRAGLAVAVVEIRALRALFALEAGDPAAGLAHARRASLMARTEGIFEAELLANLALARARRHSRQAHLALRILEALDAVATPEWRAWLDWERLLAGGAGDVSPAAEASALHRLLVAAQAGERAAFRAQAIALGAGSIAEPLRREAAVLVAAIDPHAPVDATTPVGAELAAWRRGAAALPPAFLHGLAVQASACVMAQPSGESARCLHLGLPLLAGPDVAQLRQSRLAHGRVETLLAILALAGPDGLDEASCFARAYGFSYVADRHRGVFDVLLHRARSAVGGVATVVREPGRVAIRATRPLLIPDPRSSRCTTDRVLRLLAERGRASAKEAAARLGVSLRTAQGALSDLAATQGCVVERDGRTVTYSVEDSVFSEPTRRMAHLRRELAAGA